MERVILVDERDAVLGSDDKLQVHRDGRLHRAFSIFVFNSAHELLLQKRALGKYHSGGLWSNTCCGHPRPGETVGVAANRRLREEMGFTCELREAFTFLYRTELDHDLVEHELDHVLLGRFAGETYPDPAEVCEVRWIGLDRLRTEIAKRPNTFTYWLRLALLKGQWKPAEAEDGIEALQTPNRSAGVEAC